MKKQKQRSLARLIVGFLLNIVLWDIVRQMSKGGIIEQDFHVALLGGCLAGTALVIVLPIFWRGTPWQVPLAFVLLWLPGLVLFMALSFLKENY
jgi:hypothetical protein